MVRNSTLNSALADSQNQSFKNINNLLTLQENHVEEFFQYHGEEFMLSFEKLFEDVLQRVISQMLSKLELVLNPTTNHITLQEKCLSEYNTITQANIQLDIQNLLASAVNSEVIVQRKMAKQQYLESQGFSPQTTGGQFSAPAGVGMGATGGGASGAAMGINQGMQSGYPIPPNGYDQMNNPYWIDPQTGQMTYTPPQGGLGLGQTLSKAAAWAKWLV